MKGTRYTWQRKHTWITAAAEGSVNQPRYLNSSSVRLSLRPSVHAQSSAFARQRSLSSVNALGRSLFPSVCHHLAFIANLFNPPSSTLSAIYLFTPVTSILHLGSSTSILIHISSTPSPMRSTFLFLPRWPTVLQVVIKSNT